MEKRKILTLCASALVILVSIVSITKRCGRPPKPNANPMLNLSSVIAEETVKVVKNTGQVVIVAADRRGSKEGMSTLQQALTNRSATLSVAAETISPPISQGPEGDGVAADQFFQIIQKYPNAAAVVSLVGPPLLRNAEDIARYQAKRPKVVVFLPLGIGAKRLLEQGLIDVAIIPQLGVMPPSPTMPGGAPPSIPGGPPRQSESRYLVITPDTIQSMPFEPPVPPRPPGPK